MGLITNLEKELQSQNLATNTKKAREWIKEKVKDLTNLKPALLRDVKRKQSTFDIGGMYFFVYNPKLRNDLPFYDLFPLVVPIEPYSDGFLGLNLHYLPPVPRAKLLDQLSEFATNSRYDQKTRLAVTYKILENTSKSELFRPCVKKYLTSNIRSRFLRIDANEWNIAIFLPVESFIGKTKNSVWKESRKKYQ